MKKGYLSEMSPKVKMALLSLVNDFYSIKKQRTIVVMPFFGLLHSQGNESKPFLNYVDINIYIVMSIKHYMMNNMMKRLFNLFKILQIHIMKI